MEVLVQLGLTLDLFESPLVLREDAQLAMTWHMGDVPVGCFQATQM